MALALDEKDQLAAPSRLGSVSPPLFDFAGQSEDESARVSKLPIVDLIPDSIGEQEPSFLAQARALATEDASSPMAHARLAQAAIAAGEYDQAAKVAREALAQARTTTNGAESREGGEVSDASAVYSAVRTLMACGWLDEAEGALRDLGGSGPSAVMAATLAARRGDFNGAFDLLGDDSSTDAWDLRGWIALKERHVDQAIRFYRRAMEHGDPSPALLANMGLAHAALGIQEKAIVETRQALARGPVQKQRVVFNLVAYLVATERIDEAMGELRRLQEEFPTDLEPAFAEAHWRLAVGDADRAEKRLRAARDPLWDSASTVQRAELKANQAYLRWYQGSNSRKEAAREVLRQLKGVEWKSPRLGAMIPVLLSRYSELGVLENAGERIAAANPDQRFWSIEVQTSILKDRAKAATKLAVEWAEDAIFMPEAITTATCLLIDVEDRFKDAIDLGIQALRRMPAAHPLANNIAYALVLSGHADEARKLTLNHGRDALYYLATDGLITAWRGNIESGLQKYDEAEAWAKRDGLDEAATLVALNRRVVGLAPHDSRAYEVDKPVILPSDWADNPYLVLRLRMLKRRGASLEKVSNEDGSPISLDIEPGKSAISQ